MAEINEGKSSKKAKKVSLTTLRSMLKRGVVKFEYKKKDGTIRKAEGTLRKSLSERKLLQFPGRWQGLQEIGQKLIAATDKGPAGFDI